LIAAVKDSSAWTTLEAYSIVLQKWAHVLVNLGAKEDFPQVPTYLYQY